MFVRVLPGVALSLAVACTAQAADVVVAREEAIDLKSKYVPVALDGYVNDTGNAAFPSSRITVQGIPFDLPSGEAGGNLFLSSAQWPDWAEDPSRYYSDYDSVPEEPTQMRPFFQLPVADYDSIWLLAATDPDPALSPVVSFRIGCFDGRRRTAIHDFSATVPRGSEARGENVVRALPMGGGNLFLMRVPLRAAIAQDFRDRTALDVEVTKQLRLAIRRPDPCRFRYRPLGVPGGVHIYGMTFERSAVQMEVTGDEAGHVFNEPQTPTFEVTLRGVHPAGPTSGPWIVEAVATDYYGETTTASVEIGPNFVPEARIELPIEVPRRGWYALTVNFRRGDQVWLTRETHFALLAPDTRKHRDSAPWGAWDFCGGHYTPHDPDVTGPLFVRAGLRYGMFNQPREARERYGVLKGNDSKAKSADDVRDLARRRAEDPSIPEPERIMIFHEDAISGAHIQRTPTMFTGGEPYEFDAAEQERFDALWDGAMGACREIRMRFPDAEIYFGNGNVHLLEEFLQRGFPRELFDARGNEAGNFQRPPEAQPPDFVGNNSGLWMDRQVLDYYGYEDVPLRQCYEICYPSTNPGNLSLSTQAAYYVRHILHSMAWEIPIIRAGLIVDVGNSYWFSNWGSSGLCFAQPDVSPKPSYVAVATLTQVLDGARFERVVPSAAPTVYALEFRRGDGRRVTCMWTVRGTREVQVTLPVDDRPMLVDMMGNEEPLNVRDRRAQVMLSADPVYVVSRERLARLDAGAAVLPDRPEDESFVISSLGDMDEWEVEAGRDEELEIYDFACARRQGEFDYSEVGAFEGEADVLCVSPRLPVDGPVYLPMYSALRHRSSGVEIPGEPTEIGLMVNGNGGWGRIIFELEDASGQRWISLGCEQQGEPTRWMADWLPPDEFAALEGAGLNDWNTGDPWGRSSINFEGWGYLRFPLPGNYPGEGYHWPYSSQWRYSGDGVVHYPLRFTRLIVTLPERVLRFRDYEPVPRPEIYLKDLTATYLPPEQAFTAP